MGYRIRRRFLTYETIPCGLTGLKYHQRVAKHTEYHLVEEAGPRGPAAVPLLSAHLMLYSRRRTQKSTTQSRNGCIHPLYGLHTLHLYEWAGIMDGWAWCRVRTAGPFRPRAQGLSVRPCTTDAQRQSHLQIFLGGQGTTVVFRQMDADGVLLKPGRRATALLCHVYCLGRQNCSPDRRTVLAPNSTLRIRHHMLPRACRHQQSWFDGCDLSRGHQPTAQAVGRASLMEREPHTGQLRGLGITVLLAAHDISTCYVWIEGLGHFPLLDYGDAELRGAFWVWEGKGTEQGLDFLVKFWDGMKGVITP